MPVEVIAQLMLKLVLLAAIGFVLRKRGVIDDAFQSKLSTLLIQVVLPCSILAVGNSQFGPEMTGNLLWAAGFVLVILLGSFGLAYGISRKMQLSAGNKNLFTNLVALGNVGFIGFPIIQDLYGPEGMLYTVIYNLGFWFMVFTVGLRMMGEPMSVKRFVTTPICIAAVLAIAIFVSPVRLPGMAVAALQEVGGLSGAFSMFIIGASLGKIKLRSLFTGGHAWLGTVLRQLVFPLALAAALWAAGFRGLLPATLLVLTAMPSATVNVIFAEQYGHDVAFATRGVVQGTALMVLTLPLSILLASLLFF